MAINKEELTKEQLNKLEKLYWQYKKDIIGMGLMHVVSLFLANFLISSVNILYVHNAVFVFFMAFGSAMIIFGGYCNYIDEKRDILMADIKEIVGHL